MRRHLVLIGGLCGGLCLGALAGAQPANAQFNLSPGGIFHALTRPLGAIFGNGPRMRVRPYHYESRARPRLAAPVAAAVTPADAAQPEIPTANEPTRLGAVGPLVWPDAYEDVLGYVFWPQNYDARLRAHAQGDIVATLFMPSARTAAASRAQLARSTTGSGNEADNSASGLCGSSVPQPSDWPARQIEEQIQLSEPQRAALTRLQSAIHDAVEAIRLTCRDETALPPSERLKTMEDMLWAVRDAVVLVQAPLKSFYDSLTDEQKAAFAVQAPASSGPQPARTNTAQSQHAMAARMCGMRGPSDWPVAQIDRAVRPTKVQRASLERLRQISGQMGQMLMASCPMNIAATPVERLDAVQVRLTDLILTASTTSIALNDFYGQLNAVQKVRFDSISR